MKDKFTGLYIGTKIKFKKIKEEKVVPFFKNERGDIVQTTIIIGVLAILAFFVLGSLRKPITDTFTNIKSAIEGSGTEIK